MGLYDTITTALYCPYCGKKQKEGSFQTKEFSGSFTTYSFEEFEKRILDRPHGGRITVVGEIHHICDDCGKWISLSAAFRDDGNLERFRAETGKPALDTATEGE